MKITIKPLYAVCIMAVLAGCNDNLHVFETEHSEAPAAINAADVHSEALPGQILLTWEEPAGDYAYLQIKYYDPLTKADIYKVASKTTTQMLITDTRARFGDYTFYFQTFNTAHQGSAVQEVKAVSGPAEKTYTETGRSEVKLVESQLSTNAQEPTEGPIKNLIDGNSNTFFHTKWSSPQIPLPHYIQIDFDQAHGYFALYYQNRTDNTWTTDGRPSVVELQTSNDGEEWTTVSTLSGLPNKVGSEYTSTFVMPDHTYTHFRFLVTATSGNTSYFNMAKFSFYDVDVDIYDPETVPLD
jgi:hypothetical protein